MYGNWFDTSFYFWHVKKCLSSSSPWENMYWNRFMPLFSSDGWRFQNGIFEGNQVYANNSGPALFKWRYNPQSEDDPRIDIRCFFMHNDHEINFIRRTDTNNPVVQNSEIQSFSLTGRVQPYLDSNDNTIFGFLINRVRRSDPKEYQCTTISFPSNILVSETSGTLSL